MTAAGKASVARGEDKVSAQPKARSRGQRISAKGSPASVHPTRRRRGSLPAQPEKGIAGEAEGGTSGHHAAAKAAFGKSTKPSSSRHRVARVIPKLPCLHDPVQFERGFGGEAQPVVLTRCDGRPAPDAVEQISVLVRPMNAPKPTVLATPIRHGGQQREWMPGVKLVDQGLITRLQRVADHFQAKKVTVVSGYRPSSLGSFHQSARAIDFHIDGITNEALVTFCRALDDTGCGYYPNSSFVHMDVRARRAGHVYWIDASGPGEPARYVAAWPPKESGARPNEIPRPDPAAPLDEHTHPDSQPQLPPGASDTKVDARTTAPLSTGESKDPVFAP